jgi:hypothetical protein
MDLNQINNYNPIIASPNQNPASAHVNNHIYLRKNIKQLQTSSQL